MGSLRYLMHAVQHGLPKDLAPELTDLTLIVAVMSILGQGASVKPLTSRFWREVRSMRGGAFDESA